jgi:hypothetical protein
MKNLVFIIILILLSFGCRKKQYLTIRAINPVNNKVYPGLKYSIIQQKTGNNGTVSKTIARGVLDEDGMAKVDVRILKTSPSVVIVDEPANTCFNRNITYTSGTNGSKNKEFLFEFVPCGLLKLNINNVNCTGPDDDFKLYQTGADVDYSAATGGIPRAEGTGCYSNLAVGFSKVPACNRFYKWEIIRSGILTTIYDTIQIHENENFIYNVNY